MLSLILLMGNETLNFHTSRKLNSKDYKPLNERKYYWTKGSIIHTIVRQMPIRERMCKLAQFVMFMSQIGSL